MVLYTYLLLLLWQPVLSADLCQDGLVACDAGDLEVALEEDVSEETLKLLQTKQETRQRHRMGREVYIHIYIYLVFRYRYICYPPLKSPFF